MSLSQENMGVVRVLQPIFWSKTDAQNTDVVCHIANDNVYGSHTFEVRHHDFSQAGFENLQTYLHVYKKRNKVNIVENIWISTKTKKKKNIYFCLYSWVPKREINNYQS